MCFDEGNWEDQAAHFLEFAVQECQAVSVRVRVNSLASTNEFRPTQGVEL